MSLLRLGGGGGGRTFLRLEPSAGQARPSRKSGGGGGSSSIGKIGGGVPLSYEASGAPGAALAVLKGFTLSVESLVLSLRLGGGGGGFLPSECVRW